MWKIQPKFAIFYPFLYYLKTDIKFPDGKLSGWKCFRRIMSLGNYLTVGYLHQAGCRF